MVEAAIGRVLGSGRDETVEYALVLSGDRRDFEARIVTAGPDEIVAVVRDVTARKQVESELEPRSRRRTRRTKRRVSS